jgi:hypothetical protein
MDMEYIKCILIKVKTINIPPVVQNSEHAKGEKGKPVPSTCHEGLQGE